MRAITLLMKIEALRLVCFTSISSCHGIIFVGNSTESKKCCVQRKTVRNNADIKRKVCRRKFILQASRILLSLLLLFVADQMEIFQTNSDIQDTRTDIIFLCQPLTSVSVRKEFTILQLGYSVITFFFLIIPSAC